MPVPASKQLIGRLDGARAQRSKPDNTSYVKSMTYRQFGRRSCQGDAIGATGSILTSGGERPSMSQIANGASPVAAEPAPSIEGPST